MAATINLHGDADSKSEVPSISVNVYNDYIAIGIERGADSVTFFVQADEGERVEETLGRALLHLSRPRVEVN